MNDNTTNCPKCGYSDPRFFANCPKCGHVLRKAGPKKPGRLTSESKIAYLGVELMGKHPGDALGELLFQVDQLKDKQMRAWFCDIVHDSEQSAEALWLSGEIQKKLEQLAPWQTYGKEAITVRINPFHGKFTEYRAEKEMREIINAHRKVGQAGNVSYKDQDGKDLPIEY